jgi:hypothetical protein
MKQPKNDARYEWTDHAWEKMQYYGISESRVKRIIRFPTRTEEGVAEETVAVMQPAGAKRYSEIWVMYALVERKGETQKPKEGSLENLGNFALNAGKRIRVITAWRYPGESPERDPVPPEIISEVKNLL